LGERAKGDKGKSGDGGAVAMGDDDDGEMGGGAPGDGQLEQRFKSAGGGAKESAIEGKNAKSQT
jgi:hypothetical protein